MKHETKSQFNGATDPPAFSMLEAIKGAKDAVTSMTGLGVDTVAQCQRDEGDGWRISLDVIEIPARMGDNDLLATYEVQIGPGAELLGYTRLRRYHREDGSA